MNEQELKNILESHKNWLLDFGGTQADLRGADLRDAALRGAALAGADLAGADLRDAALRDADLTGAPLTGADLRYADLRDADLRGATLTGADLRYADLTGADLRDADLRDADLRGAALTGADLAGAALPPFQIVPPDGSFIGWKKTSRGVVKLLIPRDARRTSSLVGRKCRASKVTVLEGDGCGGTGPFYKSITYEKGQTYTSNFDPDIKVECAEGIHFFMTKEEAENF